MTIEQQSLIDSLKQQAAFAYDKMDDAQVDYDKFKQVADGTSLKANQAQKIYDSLYTKYIYYPSFIKSLGKIRDTFIEESRIEQEILKQKLDLFTTYKKEYDNIISKINDNLLLINAEDLAYDLQEIADNPDSLTYSYELVDAADEFARKEAEAELTKDLISGREACVDKNRKEIDMSICKPSSMGGGGGVGGGNRTPDKLPSVSEIISKNISDWIQIVNKAVEAPAPQPTVPAPVPPSPVPEPLPVPVTEAPLSEEVQLTKTLQEEQKDIKPTVEKSEEQKIAELFSFKVDLSKIANDKLLLDKTAPSERQQNINYALCTSKKTTSVEGIDTIENIKFVINNPNSYFNGSDLSSYIDMVQATEKEIAIARAFCPTSDFSAEYYKLSSNKISFDGNDLNKKNNLTPLYYVIGGISLFFIVKSILKKSK